MTTKDMNKKDMSTNAINALCALMNKNISRDTTDIDNRIHDLKEKIMEERSYSHTVYCGMGTEYDTLEEERALILEGFFAVENGEIVWGTPWD